MDERRLLMEMDHPFILKLHDSFQDDRCVYFRVICSVSSAIYYRARSLGRLRFRKVCLHGGIQLLVAPRFALLSTSLGRKSGLIVWGQALVVVYIYDRIRCRPVHKKR